MEIERTLIFIGFYAVILSCFLLAGYLASGKKDDILIKIENESALPENFEPFTEEELEKANLPPGEHTFSIGEFVQTVKIAEQPPSMSIPKVLALGNNPLRIAGLILIIAMGMTLVLTGLLFLTRLDGALKAYVLFASGLSIFILTNTLVSRLNSTLPTIVRLSIPFFVATMLSIAWFRFPTWLTIDVAAFLIAVNILIFLAQIRLQLKQVLILFCAIMIYDVIAVFGSGTMQNFATQAQDLPLLLVVPSSLSLNSAKWLQLGLGDIVLPGLIVMLAIYEGKRLNAQRLLTVGAIGGYFVGLSIATLVVFAFRAGQPATIYLMPGALMGLLVAAWYAGVLPVLIRGKR